MNPRLAKLHEQRDLILKHLQWIDQEIAAENPAEAGRNPAAPVPIEVPPAEPKPAPIAETPQPSAIPILPLDPTEEDNAQSLKSDVRKGCLLYFGLAWVILAGVVALVYLLYN